jgi:4-amino-4-deoxy-L-arabinose transferase-like glycosyltransferase
LILVLVFVGLTGLYVIKGVQAYRGCAATFDEAVHVLPAIQESNDLQRLDFVSFLRHSYKQDRVAQYPVFQSWLLSPIFVLWSPDLIVGRVANVVIVCLSIVVGFFLAGELAPWMRYRSLTGLVGVGLVLTSLPLWVYAGRIYLEPAGLFVTLLALLCYIRAPREYDGRFWLMGCSLAMAAGFFTKYSFGLFIFGGLDISVWPIRVSIALVVRQSC